MASVSNLADLHDLAISSFDQEEVESKPDELLDHAGTPSDGSYKGT